MIIVPAVPAKPVPVFESFNAGGGAGGGYVGDVMTRSWSHTVTNPGALLVFVGSTHESSTSDTTSMTIGGATLPSLAANWARAANRTYWVEMFGAVVGPGTHNLVLTQTNGGGMYQYADVATAHYANATTIAAAANAYPDVAATSITKDATPANLVVCGLYGNGTPFAEGHRGTNGWVHIADLPGGAPRTFTWAGTAVAGVTVLLS